MPAACIILSKKIKVMLGVASSCRTVCLSYPVEMRLFLDARYHSALATSSASAPSSASTTAPASAPVTGDHLLAPSLRPSCTLGNRGIVYTPSRSTAVRCGAIGSGSTIYALRGMPGVAADVARRMERPGATEEAAAVAMTCEVACAMACAMAYAV